MNILITYATKGEAQRMIEYLRSQSESFSHTDKDIYKFEFFGLKITLAITGVGQVAVTHKITKLLSTGQYDKALNLGICGAFPESNLNIGDVVEIGTEIFGDFGVDDQGQLETIFEMGLLDPDQKPFKNGELHNPWDTSWTYPFVEAARLRSLSVSLVSGELTQIVSRKQKFSVDVENMEGAAFFYVCLLEGVEFVEVRAVSNIVEPRKKEKWQIPLALERLFEASKFMIMELASKN